MGSLAVGQESEWSVDVQLSWTEAEELGSSVRVVLSGQHWGAVSAPLGQ